MNTATATHPASPNHGVSGQSVETVEMTSGSSLKHSFVSVGIHFPGIDNLNTKYPSSPSEPKKFIPRFVAWKDFGHSDVSHSIFALPFVIRHPNAKWEKGPIAIIGNDGETFFIVERSGDGTTSDPHKYTAKQCIGARHLPENVRFFAYTRMDV